MIVIVYVPVPYARGLNSINSTLLYILLDITVPLGAAIVRFKFDKETIDFFSHARATRITESDGVTVKLIVLGNVDVPPI